MTRKNPTKYETHITYVDSSIAVIAWYLLGSNDSYECYTQFDDNAIQKMTY